MITVLRQRGSDDSLVLRGEASLVWSGLDVPGTEAEVAADVVEVWPTADAGSVGATFQELIDGDFVRRV